MISYVQYYPFTGQVGRIHVLQEYNEKMSKAKSSIEKNTNLKYYKLNISWLLMSCYQEAQQKSPLLLDNLQSSYPWLSPI